MSRVQHLRPGALGLLVLLTVAGCGSAPSRAPTADNAGARTASGGHRIVAIARDQVGTPYRYGGASPRGFDCSGLVHFAYRRAGFRVPRTTRGQLHDARRISPSELAPGDVVFFRISRRKVSHVGIYAGNGRFIHAPSSGKTVSVSSLENPYWHRRLVAAGRLY